MRALLIDDNHLDRRLICRLLKKIDLNVHVTEAPDAIAALEALEEQEFDCLLIDQRMPGIIGTELVRGLRAMEHGANLPMIMLSGVGPDYATDTESDAIGAGVDLFLAKQDLTAANLEALLLEAIASRNAQSATAPSRRLMDLD